MKSALKYLILCLASVVFMDTTWTSCPDTEEGQVCFMGSTTASFELSSNSSISDMCNPLQDAVTGKSNLKNGSKRTENSHRKKADFIKSQKSTGSDIRNIVRERSSGIPLSFNTPDKKLAVLHRLVI